MQSPVLWLPFDVSLCPQTMKFRSDCRMTPFADQAKTLYQAGRSTKEIGKILGIDPSNVVRFFQKDGFKMRTKRASISLAIATGRRGKRAGLGIGRHSKGYRLIRRPGHARQDARGYVFEHVLVAQEMIGRPLNPNEIVHHKNHVKTDNRRSNLAVMTRGDHQRMHWKKNRLAWLKNLERARHTKRRK